MNMKKSIAGVMAGAMAVSAMAATVSADQDTITLTYDLKTYVEATDSTASVTFTVTFDESNTSESYLIGATKSAELMETGATTLTVGVNESNIINNSLYGGSLSDVQITATPNKNLVTDEQGAAVTVKFTNDASKTDGSIYNSSLSGTSWELPLKLVDDNKSFPMADYDLYTLGYSDGNDEAPKQYSTNTFGFKSLTLKLTYDVPAEVLADNSNAWSWSASTAAAVLGYTGDEENTAASHFNVNDAASTITLYSSKDGGVSTGKVAISGFTNDGVAEYVYPLKSDLSDPADVVAALQSRKTGGNYYTKPVAVINDAIANHENVTFTFTSYDGYVATAESHFLKEWVKEGVAYGWQTSSYDWYNPTFGQHLYTNLYDSYSLAGSDEYDMYGSYSSAWGINLFTGAIVVNSQLTMQLNDTDKFNWGDNTLTFDWATITEDGKITDAKTFLTSMLLYTPTEWYWDNLTVTVGGEMEDVTSGEGLVDEGEEIDDESDDEEIVEDEPEEEVEVVVEEEVDEPEVEVAPVETVASPSTGNASVALAVIPVALAAAAVVAKKRG